MRKFLSVLLSLCIITGIATTVTINAGAYTIDSAQIINFNTQYSGIVNNGESVYYEFYVPKSGKVKVNATSTGDKVYFDLFDAKYTDVIDLDGWGIDDFYTDYDSNRGYYSNDYIYYLLAGTYYLSADGYSATFNFSLKYTSSGESFEETQSQKYDYYSQAKTIQFDKKYKGMICDNDYQDIYKFSVPATCLLKVSVVSDDAKIYGGFYNSNCEEVFYGTDDLITEKDDRKGYYSITKTFRLSKGTYYLDFENYDGSIYNFKITFTPVISKSKITSAVGSKRKVKLTWSRSSNGNGYVVYCSNKAHGKYSKIKTITNPKVTKFIHKKLNRHRKYFYKIKTYKKVNGKTYYTGFSSAKCGKTK
ncbi:MAG: hypothetical protein ACI4HO_07010 [Ruminococcus sp.]